MSVAPEIQEVEIVRQEALTVSDQVKRVVVIDPETMAKANEFFLIIKAMRKKIADKMDPLIAAAFDTHKKAIGLKKESEQPLIVAESWLNGQISTYTQEQERIRKDEVDRLRKIEESKELAKRKEEEKNKLAEAEILEAAGMKDEAAQLVSEAIQQNEAPLAVKIPEPLTPKVAMRGMAMQTYYHFEIVNESLIPREYLIPDESKIGGVVRSAKGKITIPGIRVWSDTKAKSTGR